MAPAWPEAAIPDLTGVTAVVTGASGIGREVARGLAGKGARVMPAVRSTEGGQSAAAAIRHARS